MPTNNDGSPWLRPGSPDAVSRGCTCPVMDNAGQEKYFWVSTLCPLHGHESLEDDDELHVGDT